MTDAKAKTHSGAVLATDLDGTLIPLNGNQQNQADLVNLTEELVNNKVELIFVTGRHFDSVMQVVQNHNLPIPSWIICDVGTSLYQQQPDGQFQLVQGYQQHQQQIISSLPIVALQEKLQCVEGLRLQEQEKQGPFKLSYYTDAAIIQELHEEIQTKLTEWQAPYSIIHSVDPFNGDGLIDLLPEKVSKAYALNWWSEHANLHPEQIVFAGDSGNDFAALAAGYRAIVVGNAGRVLARRVYAAHKSAGWKNRLYMARQFATSAVLAGCRWFGLLEHNLEHNPTPSGPLGATPLSNNTTHFRVWAPKQKSVRVEITSDQGVIQQPLAPQKNGYFSGTIYNAAPLSKYHYLLDTEVARPDPVSKYQPDGVHGMSQIIDPNSYPWCDQKWSGISKQELIIYELHIGTFTTAGTFRAAMERLPELQKLGITAIEIMPIAQTPGRWNWGYDGVDLFAVRNTYGTPDDFKAFVDACHQAGISVILDVVYNHIGPEGNYMAEFGPYFSRQHKTPWGAAFNYDGHSALPVREFIIANALYWLEEYHLDGLRLDAVHLMFDESHPSILSELRSAVSQFEKQAGRIIHLIAEANVFDESLLTSNNEGSAYDAIWCDCLMHCIYSLALPDLQLTNRKYDGAADLLEALRHGYLYTGAEHQRVAERSYTKTQLKDFLTSYVVALQTHDVIGNHPDGKRIHQLTSHAYQKAAAALVLLYPGIPLLFMGEESAVDAPFLFFADFEEDRLRKAVDRGRRREYPQHDWRAELLPSQENTFYQSQCPPANSSEKMYNWYRELIALRKSGLRENWLSPEKMSVDYDAEHDIFRLCYASDNSIKVEIYCRLLPNSSDREKPYVIKTDKQLLLSSEVECVITDGKIELQGNHAVILAEI